MPTNAVRKPQVNRIIRLIAIMIQPAPLIFLLLTFSIMTS